MIPSDLAASTARVRAIVVAAGLGRDLAEAELHAYDALSRDREALAKLGAQLYDRMVEWKTAGLTAKQIASRPVQARYTRRAIDVDPEVMAWAVTCRAAAVLLAAEHARIVGVENLTTLKTARARVLAAAQGA